MAKKVLPKEHKPAAKEIAPPKVDKDIPVPVALKNELAPGKMSKPQHEIDIHNLKLTVKNLEEKVATMEKNMKIIAAVAGVTL